MNDDELELRLREELHRRVVAPDAPERLYHRVGRIGLDGDAFGHGGAPTVVGRLHFARRGLRIAGGLAAAACVAALLAVSLAWRQSPGPVSGASATPSVTPSATSSQLALASPSPIPTGTPTPIPTWAGQPVVAAYVGRLDAHFGWVVGNTSATGDGPKNLYVTRDGGSTWQTSTPPDIGNWTTALQFSDRDHGSYAVGRTVYLTGDGGSTWTASTVPGSSGLQVWSLDMLDGRLLWAYLSDDAGKTELWATTDGGATWSLRLRGTSPFPNFTFVSETEGWGWLGTMVAGDNGRYVKSVHTLDGGRTWSSAALPLPADYQSFLGMYQPLEMSGNRIVATLLARATSKQAATSVALALVSSNDGGASWDLTSTVPLPSGPPVRVGRSGSLFWVEVASGGPGPALTFLDPNGPASSATVDYPTTACEPPTAANDQSVNTAFDFVVVSTTAAWLACGTSLGAAPVLSYLYATTDGGKTWRGLLGAP